MTVTDLDLWDNYFSKYIAYCSEYIIISSEYINILKSKIFTGYSWFTMKYFFNHRMHICQKSRHSTDTPPTLLMRTIIKRKVIKMNRKSVNI